MISICIIENVLNWINQKHLPLLMDVGLNILENELYKSLSSHVIWFKWWVFVPYICICRRIRSLHIFPFQIRFLFYVPPVLTSVWTSHYIYWLLFGLDLIYYILFLLHYLVSNIKIFFYKGDKNRHGSNSLDLLF